MNVWLQVFFGMNVILSCTLLPVFLTFYFQSLWFLTLELITIPTMMTILTSMEDF